jgi:hypothetical protein
MVKPKITPRKLGIVELLPGGPSVVAALIRLPPMRSGSALIEPEEASVEVNIEPAKKRKTGKSFSNRSGL